MRRLVPLVLRLLTVSLVALALAETGGGSNTTSQVTSPGSSPATSSASSQASSPASSQASSPASSPTTTPTPKPTTKRPRAIRPTLPLPRVKSQRRNRGRPSTMTTARPKTFIEPRTLDHTEASCTAALGMQNGLISNDSLSASSSYDQSVSPLSARVRTEIRGGAWCPNGLIKPHSREFLQIDLKDEYVITASETQGRFANSVGVEFVGTYILEYWRDSLNRWATHKNLNGSRLIPGNVDTYTTNKIIIDSPFVASKVRYYPYADHPRTSCMRAEIYGCLWKQPIRAYSAPPGGQMPTMTNGARFEDLSYDGEMRNGIHVDGLGQLTDSLYGPNDFEIPEPGDMTGSHWVGWNNTVMKNNEVVLTFNLTDPRSIHYMNIHTNNMFTKDVQLFKEAIVYFSLEGELWQIDYISYEPKQDKVAEDARLVRIDLENRTAQFIMVKLKFQNKWILISEVTFDSVPVVLNCSLEYLEEYYQTDYLPSSKLKKNSSLQVSIGLACTALIAGGAIFAMTTILLNKRIRRRIPNLLKKPFCPKLRLGSNSRNNRRTPRLAMALAKCPPIHMLRPAVVDEDYREPYNIWKETIGRRDKFPAPFQNEYNEIVEDNDFPRPYMMKRPEPHETFYAATDIINHLSFPEERYMRRERPEPGLFTSIKLPEAEPPNGVAPLLDFPRGRMRPITFLGKSLHGNLQICETDGIEELSDEEPQPKNGRGRIVVVKTLWRGCHNDVKAAFAREATWGAGLKHPQLARVLGLSLLEPPCAALDRGDAAPLPMLLRTNRKLNYSSLIHICCQISNGMKYLESFELVHRDLAARNITASKDLNIKISDYAMFCDDFANDYHVMEDRNRIPLRWMPWESLLLDIYSPSSDVWSFGVTVWEILTYCYVKPFDEMDDDQVVENAIEWRCGGRGARVPAAPPPRCRRELYDLMHECWRREPEQRPRFSDLNRFLERMTHGYKPPLVR